MKSSLQEPLRNDPLPIVVERDDGLWSIGWHDDAPGPFPSRRFAEQVQLQSHRRVLQ
jgi:hypothetical protein